MGCRIELDWIGLLVQLVALVFFTSGLWTKHWSEAEDGSSHSGLFQTCLSEEGHCFDVHVHFDAFPEKRDFIGAAVMELLVFAGILLSLLCFVCYMFGLFEEKSVGLFTAVVCYANGLFGLIGIIIYGAAANKISYKISWSFALALLGLLANMTAGVFIHIASHRYKNPRIFDPPPPPGKIHPFIIARPHISRRFLHKDRPRLLPM